MWFASVVRWFGEAKRTVLGIGVGVIETPFAVFLMGCDYLIETLMVPIT